MILKKSLIALAGLLLAPLAGAPADARVRAGMLTCSVAPGMSFIVGSQKDMRCDFRSVRGWHESYAGRITRFGLDVGFTSGGTIAWAVYAPTEGGHGALAGVYGGASGEATIGGGVGGNVLIGGFDRSVMLQPLSVGAQKGLDLAVAVGGLELWGSR
ncbi:MAG TPA: DUF992 domain-containing protein [Pseudolabrys sp.]|jgi:hypothetical protein|nr:DUF992 domain-containing protein [Pseudolabrys sp.]